MSTAIAAHRPTSLLERFGSRYNVEPAKILDTLKATAFKTRDGRVPSNQEMMALLIVADQYKLNPFTKEIYAFPDRQSGIVPIVGVDGWNRICNDHPQYDGVEFRYSPDLIQIDEHHKPAPQWCEAIIYRKDRNRPTVVREYLDEVYRPPFVRNGSPITGPWQSHTKRFLRHKALIQAARVAFGFGGIHDEDEAVQILERGEDGVYRPIIREETKAPETPAKTTTSKLDALAGEDEAPEPAPAPKPAPTTKAKGNGKAKAKAAEVNEDAKPPRFTLAEDGVDVIDQQTGEIVPDECVKRFEDGTFSVLRSYQERAPKKAPALAEGEDEDDFGLFGAEV